MKITHIETYPTRLPVRSERRVGHRNSSDCVIVRVLTDVGLDGVGEANGTARWSGETVWGTRAVIEHVLAPLLINGDPREIDDINRRMDQNCAHNWFAKAALEMACWDLRGKEAGVPVYELLGGAIRAHHVQCRFSMADLAPGSAGVLAAQLVSAGFTAFKVKVGGDAATDQARVEAVREAIGPTPTLVIDATGKWDAGTAIELIDRMAACDLAFVEQPTPRGDYAAMARVREKSSVPIMADDSCFDLVHAKELIRGACCDALSVYPGKNAGLRKTKQITEFAAAHGVACTIGSNFEWDITTAAMGHLVIACQNIQVERIPGDMLGPDHYELSIARNPVEIAGPIATVPDGPGLGVEVDWDIVRTHSCA
jgi:muconate cycloisomerase